MAETASTNADLKQLVSQTTIDEGYWLRAEKQSGGVGRLGRKWESPVGNLYCSTIIGVRPGDPPPSSLAFVTGLAVYQVIGSYLPRTKVMLKWPNDILLDGAKVCGILLERVGDHVVAGIGVNISVAPVIAGRAVTRLNAHGAEVDAADFLNRLTVTFAEFVASWRELGLHYILDQWQKAAHPLGSAIMTSDEQGQKLRGNFAGLAADGALRLSKADGTLIEIRSGDVDLA